MTQRLSYILYIILFIKRSEASEADTMKANKNGHLAASLKKSGTEARLILTEANGH